MMITPFARLPRLSLSANAIARATAEKPAIIPAVEKPSELTRTITSAIYKTTVTIEITNDAAALSSLLLFKETLLVIACTIFIMTSPRTKKAIVRTIVRPVSVTKFCPKLFSASKNSCI